jgi:hypothetical protein
MSDDSSETGAAVSPQVFDPGNVYGRTFDVIYGRSRPSIYTRTYSVVMGRTFDVIYGRPFPGSL